MDLGFPNLLWLKHCSYGPESDILYKNRFEKWLLASEHSLEYNVVRYFMNLCFFFSGVSLHY